MRILVTGGSHVVALNQGFKQLRDAGKVPASLEFILRPLGGGLSVARDFYSPRDDHVEITNPKYWAKFRQIPPPGETYGMVAVSTALYSRPVWNKSDWGVYGIPGFAKDRIPISEGLLRRAIYDDNKHIIGFLAHLRTLGMKVCIVEGPRPFRHNIEVKRNGPDLVKHIDALYRSLTLEVLSREQIPVVLVPDTAFDTDGFMLEKYRHKNPDDKTHGSSEFGLLMMERVLQFVQKNTDRPG